MDALSLSWLAPRLRAKASISFGPRGAGMGSIVLGAVAEPNPGVVGVV